MRTLPFLLLAACGPTVLEPTTPAVHALILEPVCATSGCHLRPEPQQGLDYYDEESTLATMVDVEPTVGGAADVYDAIVVPGDPDGSFLIAKVLVPGVEQGVAMPPSGEQLTAEAVEVLREWILALPEELE
ncbi:MAG: hypothetical protein KC912_18310 [Proteobacteria bacterium]|nr:hypothetical protein [Pseudomonadota bacterium]